MRDKSSSKISKSSQEHLTNAWEILPGREETWMGKTIGRQSSSWLKSCSRILRGSRCRGSKMLSPRWQGTADLIRSATPNCDHFQMCWPSWAISKWRLPSISGTLFLWNHYKRGYKMTILVSWSTAIDSKRRFSMHGDSTKEIRWTATSLRLTPLRECAHSLSEAQNVNLKEPFPSGKRSSTSKALLSKDSKISYRRETTNIWANPFKPGEHTPMPLVML